MTIATDPIRSKISNADKMFGISTRTDSGKFYLRRDGQYLHLTAKKLTPIRADAWVGSERQGINCIVKFPMAKGCALSPID